MIKDIKDIKGQNDEFYSISGDQAKEKSNIPKIKIATTNSDLIQDFPFGEVVYNPCQDGSAPIPLGNRKSDVQFTLDAYFLKIQFLYQTKYVLGKISRSFESAQKAREAGYVPFGKESLGEMPVYPAALTYILIDLTAIKDHVVDPFTVGDKYYGVIEQFFSNRGYDELVAAKDYLCDKQAKPLWSYGFKMYWKLEAGKDPNSKKEYFRIKLDHPFASQQNFIDSVTEQCKKKMITTNVKSADDIPF